MLFYVLVPIIIGVALQRLLFAGVEAPPSDYGSGSMFDRIATRYDLINRVLALNLDTGWRQTMVNTIQATGATNILDVATGTADVALLLAASIPSAQITGVDPSANMLRVGEGKIRDRQLQHRITLNRLDPPERFHFSSDTFDGATMAFGIRNVPNKHVTLCEIHRILQEGATFCILEFSAPEPDTTLHSLAGVFIRHVVPFLGGMLSGRPREYWHLQNSIKDFPSPKHFQRLLETTVCDTGRFDFTSLAQLSFNSVQLYTVKINKGGAAVE